MSEFIREAEELAESRLSEALTSIWQAQGKLDTARNATGDGALRRKIEDYQGALSLIIDSATAQRNKLRDILDPS